jgi:aldehyde dehydrogenase (NAD+)
MADLAARFLKVTAGTPEMDRELGPLISAKQKRRVEGMVAAAEAHGARKLAEGQIAAGAPAEGFFVKPAIYGIENTGMALAREEVFGPILAAMPFRDEAEAVRLANSTDFGLVAGVWSGDGARAMRVARKVKVGQVFINGYGAGGGIELPFGGMKKSGHGREKGFVAMHEFSALKTLVFKHG